MNVEVTIAPAIPQGMTGTLDLKVYDPDNALADGPDGKSEDGDPDSYNNGANQRGRDSFFEAINKSRPLRLPFRRFARPDY